MTAATGTGNTDDHLAKRLQRLESLEAIRRLVQQYSFDVDDHRIDSLAEAFAEDSRYCSLDRRIDVSGRANIHAYFTQRMAQLGPTCHITHDHVIDFDDEDPTIARGRVTSHAEVVSDGRQMCTCLCYLDTYVFEAERWRFHEREMHFLYFCPADDYPRILTSRKRKLMGGEWSAADLPEASSGWSGQPPVDS
ncbi:MAG: nuclear transport factor 2 family protein [Pseudomonadota bacterium]